jgi:hypothetical protein
VRPEKSKRKRRRNVTEETSEASATQKDFDEKTSQKMKKEVRTRRKDG